MKAKAVLAQKIQVVLGQTECFEKLQYISEPILGGRMPDHVAQQATNWLLLVGCVGPTLGWPGGEVEVTKKKIQIIFLPLMVLGNESQKEF